MQADESRLKYKLFQQWCTTLKSSMKGRARRRNGGQNNSRLRINRLPKWLHVQNQGHEGGKISWQNLSVVTEQWYRRRLPNYVGLKGSVWVFGSFSSEMCALSWKENWGLGVKTWIRSESRMLQKSERWWGVKMERVNFRTHTKSRLSRSRKQWAHQRPES